MMEQPERYDITTREFFSQGAEIAALGFDVEIRTGEIVVCNKMGIL